MNKAQKELLQAQLDAEKEQLKTLKGIYKKAEQDIDDKIAQLMGRSDADMQNVIYQLEYQKALKKQVSGILDTLHGNEFTSVSEYLTKCYENGFVGTMYDIHKQGIPIIEPIDQSLIAKAITVDTKLSQGLYERLGEDVSQLKKRIANNISRGIATGSTFAEIARNVKGVSNVSYNNAMRIVKTEGGRINAQASHHAQQRAKKAGADVVKQWNSTLDGKTRDTHRELDGKLAEVDEPFKLHGLEAMFPHDFGSPEEDINCRCTILQRAKWALDEDELKELEARAEYFGLDKADGFTDFKKKYLRAAKEVDNLEVKNAEQLQKYSEDKLKKYGITVNMSNVDSVIKEAKENIDILDQLLSEYNSTLKTFEIRKGNVANEGGATYWLTDKITGMRVLPSNIKMTSAARDELGVGKNKYLETITHEFAHTLSSSTRDNDADFWREIKAIKRDYKKELGKIELGKSVYTKDKVFISNYANKNVDEFLADAFAQAKLSESPSPYAIKVIATVDKYFKKESFVKAGKSSIIKEITIHRGVGAAAKNYQVKLIDGNQHTKLAERQRITGKTFAGKGTDKEIRERFRLESEYYIPADEWEKVSGKGYVIVDGKERLAELHWYEAEDEIYEMKVKRFLDES